jgi:hypothetical protein
MTELALKLIAALAAIADGLNNVACAIKGNGLAVPVQASLELKSEPAATGSVSPSLDALKEKAAKDAAEKKAKVEAKAKEDAASKAEAKADSEAKAKETPPANSGTKAPSVDDLRKVGTALVADGKKTEFLAILAKFEAKNVTSVPEAKRADCLVELEKALGKKLAELAE